MAPLKNVLILLVVLATVVCDVTAYPQPKEEPDINTVLMKSTFEILGRGAHGWVRGTVFIMGRPIPNEVRKSRYVMITAAHVLSDIRSQSAVLYLRRKTATGDWVPLPFPIQVRSGTKPLWTKNPKADVAVMYVALPNTVMAGGLVTTNLLADDATLSRFEIHPGDELECLGYPLGAAANGAGFPILRSGKIASYPLLPTEKVRTFLFDFRVFPGNSGGPVYIAQANRFYKGGTHLGMVHFILGLVTEERFANVKYMELNEANQNEEGVKETPLDLGVVVDASLIKQTIEMLPPPGATSLVNH